MNNFKNKFFSLLAGVTYAMVCYSQDYSGRHNTDDSNSSGGAFVLFILLIAGGFYLFSIIATKISDYSIKKKQEKNPKRKRKQKTANGLYYESSSLL